MSNRHTLLHNRPVEFYIYESGDEDYGIHMSVDADHVDARICIPNLTSKQVIEIGLEMISAALPSSEEAQVKRQKIMNAVAELQKAILHE